MSNVLAKNKTENTITVSSWTIYYINSSNSELITAYDSSNNPYGCFKYVVNNTSYYYVIDGIHNVWVNDLSEWGYKEIQTSIPIGGIISETSSSSFLFPLQGMKVTVDNISLVGNKPSFGGFVIIDNISLVGNKPSFGGFVTQDLTI